jgi:dihydrofolate reductase
MEKSMTLNAILAHDDRCGIGKNGVLPWPHNSADMKWFRECTNGHVVVMGRKTWESIGSKRLPNRINVVVSNQDFPHTKDGGPDHVLNGDLTSGLKVLLPELYPHLKIWIIGGANIYGQALHLCDNIYVTRFKGDYDCDVIVPMNRHLVGYCEMAKKEQGDLTFSIWKKL